jgi:hypothetical protein
MPRSFSKGRKTEDNSLRQTVRNLKNVVAVLLIVLVLVFINLVNCVYSESKYRELFFFINKQFLLCEKKLP